MAYMYSTSLGLMVDGVAQIRAFRSEPYIMCFQTTHQVAAAAFCIGAVPLVHESPRYRLSQ